MEAELSAVCAEFQRNFGALTLKYQQQTQELDAERLAHQKTRRHLDELTQQQEKLQSTLRETQVELREASEYREKYRASSVVVEHLKGRLETARRGVADSVVEHDQLTEQLRGQIQDLMSRVEGGGEAQQLHHLRSQVRELEERCALLVSQLAEEKERAVQHQLSSNAALREVHSRSVEAEQRYRALESDVTSMRSAIRRSLDLQQEAAAQREKALLDLQNRSQECAALRQQLQAATDRIAASQSHHEEEMSNLRRAMEEMSNLRRAMEEERRTTAERLSQLASERSDAVAARELEEERRVADQRLAQKRLAELRAEFHRELDEAQLQHSEVRSELHKTRFRLQNVDQQLQDVRRTAAALESQAQRAEEEKQQLRTHLEQSVQQEAWGQAERDHTVAQLRAQTTKVEELSAAAQRADGLEVENGKLRLALEYKEVEVSEAKTSLRKLMQQMTSAQEQCERRCMSLYREGKQYKRLLRAELARSETLRRKVNPNPPSDTRVSPLVVDIDHPRQPGGTQQAAADAVSLLRPLQHQADELEAKIASLAKGR